MKRSAVSPSPFNGIHVGIIMDGNGRWAAARGLPRTAGHRAGVRTARKIVEAATRSPASARVTLYAFSSDNWSRPTPEVGALMRLLRRSLLDRVQAVPRERRATHASSGVATGCPPRSSWRSRKPRRSRRTGGTCTFASRSTTRRANRSCRRRRSRSGEAAHPRAVRASARPGEPRSVRGARRRSAHSHRRRAAAERLPAVGVRVRRVLLHAVHVARIHGEGIPGGARASSRCASAASAACRRRRRASRRQAAPWRTD